MEQDRLLELGELARKATCGVFDVMLDLELEARKVDVNPSPIGEGEVTAFLGLAGDQQGFVAIHCAREQAQAFTACMLGTSSDEIEDEESILDAMGEVINMIGGNVKTEFVAQGTLQISLPTVVMNPRSQIRVKVRESVMVELMLTEPNR